MSILRKIWPTDKNTGVSLKLEADGSTPVVLQDQTSPILIVPFHNTAATTTLTVATAKDDYVINVTSVTGFVVGQYLTIYNIAGNRFYQARIMSIASLAVTVDTPLDFEYQILDEVSVGGTDLNVDGSVTPQIFNLRLPEPGLSIIGDITRVMLIMETVGPPGWNEFGDIAIPAGFRGIVFRKVDGAYMNIGQAVKTNSELAAMMFDFDPIDQAKFSVYGIKGRLTFAGQSKIGVTIRLAVGEDLQVIIQDDLTSLDRFSILAEGHVVIP
ncbi:MAG: hypothetical protein KAR40_07900 [Candidatus Sabulitectum sp.]|nr:hypothetical protein [Candidatus Sabulitectum sp.]